jgi:hypothetical protein
MKDAGLTWQRQLAHYYIGFVFADPAHYPNVDVYAEKGSGLQTVVGAVLPNFLKAGQVLDPDKAQFYTRDGDINQGRLDQQCRSCLEVNEVLSLQSDEQQRGRPFFSSREHPVTQPAGARSRSA